MAEIMAEMQQVHPGQTGTSSGSVTTIVNLLGAVTSLALVVGVGLWGYKLLARDVSGVPVVRAAEGPMRVQPENPGGRQALHQGLAVNDVVADGTAADPADRLILAPAPLSLTLEDRPVRASQPAGDETRTAESGEALPRTPQTPQTPEALRQARVEALANRLAEGVAPLESLPETQPAAPADGVVARAATPPVEGGLGRSLRPQLRPASLVTEAVAAPSLSEGLSTRDIDPDTIPVGTRLAQLGAFASREIAEKEWTKLTERFAEYLDGKDRVIQKATSGGRTFYRLRAMGFEDLNDARRFCSALVSERAECIPVVTR